MKPEWPRLAFVEDLAARCDQIKSIRPARIRGFHAVVETINQGRELDSQLSYAGAGHGSALRLVLGAAEEHIVADVRLHLPNIGGMRLKDINRIKIDLILVLL
jgi:hypothetical protein